MSMAYVPPRKNKASNIKLNDVGNNFQSDDVESALQELAENGGAVTNIDDNSTATNKTWSASKVNAQFNTIAKKTYIEDGKLYLLQEDGTKIDTGTTLPTGGSGGGIDGREIELQKSTTHIQWRYVGDLNWTNLVLLSDITGGNGKGINSISKTNTVNLVDTYTITFTDNSTTTFEITNGSNGTKGDPGATPNIQIGTVETLASGIDATASIGGTVTNPLLNLGIPRGVDGGSVKDTLVTTNIVGTTLTLTKDKYQTTTMVDGTDIVLPAITEFTEIHLFFSANTDMTLIMPNCKWQTIPTITANKFHELIFTYTTEWLAGVVVYE